MIFWGFYDFPHPWWLHTSFDDDFVRGHMMPFGKTRSVQIACQICILVCFNMLFECTLFRPHFMFSGLFHLRKCPQTASDRWCVLTCLFESPEWTQKLTPKGDPTVELHNSGPLDLTREGLLLWDFPDFLTSCPALRVPGSVRWTSADQ